jgi:uncharacterized protein GlcG (DUF336 family)
VKNRLVLVFALMCTMGTAAFANNCPNLPTESQLRAQLIAAPSSGGDAGGLFHGTLMWGAIVDRNGEICSFATSTSDPTQVWPGSQAIAKAKAFTANAFSNDSLPLSSALLYTFTQPGHSLWSLGQSNLWDPGATIAPGGQGGHGDNGQIAGGLIFFGGGVPLYKNGKIIGALGISGDTSCADHEIAKRVRHLLGLDPVSGPRGSGQFSDDISYSSADGASVFTHPLCLNTYRNGTSLGSEASAVGY